MRGVGITGAPLGGQLQVQASVDDDIALRLQVPQRDGGVLDVDAEMRLQGRELPTQGGLPAVLPRASGHVVGHWRFPSLAWVTTMFNAPDWLQLDGSGDLVADLRLDQGRPAPGSRGRARRELFSGPIPRRLTSSGSGGEEDLPGRLPPLECRVRFGRRGERKPAIDSHPQ